MSEIKQTQMVRWTIVIPMEFPIHWDKDMCDFHLNESSWCCDNLIAELEKLSEKYGCICNFCEAEIL